MDLACLTRAAEKKTQWPGEIVAKSFVVHCTCTPTIFQGCVIDKNRKMNFKLWLRISNVLHVNSSQIIIGIIESFKTNPI